MAPSGPQKVLAKGEKRSVNWSNIALGGVMNVFEVSTLGQPFEVVKTQMASQRAESMGTALSKVWGRGGVLGFVRDFYQGLFPWALVEASTKGAVLLFAAAEIEAATMNVGVAPAAAGLLGGMGGGVVQAYATMGFCTCMKTAEITRSKVSANGIAPPSTWALFADMYKKGGIAGINKGVNAVAVRQCTNWGSRMGFARLAEQTIRKSKGLREGDKLGAMDRIMASAIGGALGCWNQPIEVVRVEMQSMATNVSVNRPAKLTVFNTLGYIYKESGIKGLYRGVTPRIGLGIWQTVCMVSFADIVKDYIGGRK